MRPGASGSLDDGQGFTTQRYRKGFTGVPDLPENSQTLRFEFGDKQRFHKARLTWSRNVVNWLFRRFFVILLGAPMLVSMRVSTFWALAGS